MTSPACQRGKARAPSPQQPDTNSQPGPGGLWQSVVLLRPPQAKVQAPPRSTRQRAKPSRLLRNRNNRENQPDRGRAGRCPLQCGGVGRSPPKPRQATDSIVHLASGTRGLVPGSPPKASRSDPASGRITTQIVRLRIPQGTYSLQPQAHRLIPLLSARPITKLDHFYYLSESLRGRAPAPSVRQPL